MSISRRLRWIQFSTDDPINILKTKEVTTEFMRHHNSMPVGIAHGTDSIVERLSTP